MKKNGHGIYSPIELKSGLPKFFLAYIGDPSDSGKIHNDVFARWKSGDPEVLDAVRMFAQFTEDAKLAIEGGDWETLAVLMNKVGNGNPVSIKWHRVAHAIKHPRP